ncbi:tRNA (N(6)-L-threonylcarbamoyladenosine(37)-C(2))-methylthiotransferase [Candidatus Bathyarchaeota archaeon]|nr:tRNA (N(6)-L-threonylcarbamoyladenosine(37)-C(2))-methylthiotransferase [Candidatus Bathyarchaeota archaeon]
MSGMSIQANIRHMENKVDSSSTSRVVYVESYGCAANKADLEIMLAHILDSGYRISSNLDEADIIVVNTCGVKKPTEDRILNRLRLFSCLNKPLIVTGCLPKINLKSILKAAPNISVILDPYSVDKIVSALKLAERGEKKRIFFSDKPNVKLKEPKIRLNKVIEIIPISEGCLGACSFCCVRFARGTLFSYPADLIIKRLRDAISEGAKEIWLTSQDNGAYGLDAKTNLAELLRKCCMVNGKFFIRVGMMNPNHVLKMLPDLIDTYKNKRIFKFLHLPVQSGDDEILRLMNRRYTVEDFKAIINSFRKEIPDITIATDVICGFPSESRKAFEKTLKLIEEVKPDIVNISKFFPRPNTPAARMKQIDSKEVAFRSRMMTKLASDISLKRNEAWIGWEGEILVDEKGIRDSWIGRNYAYKPIVVRSQENLLGKFINVKIIEAHTNYLEAKII